MDPYPCRCRDSLLPSRHVNTWQLIKSFWQSENCFPAYLFFTIVTIMTVTLVGLHLAYNYWYNYFYDVLQSYDKQGMPRFLIVSFILAGFYLLLTIYRFYVPHFFGLRWRRWLTQQCMGWLLQKRGHLEQEKVGSLVNFSIDLSMGLIRIITTSLMFIYYLLLLSYGLENLLSKWGNLPVANYALWIGVIYALVGTFFTLKFGRPFLSRYRDRSRTDSPWLFWFRASYNQMLIILPLLIVFPNYFEIVFLAGWFLQSLQTFNRVQSSFPSIVNSYPLLSKGYASDSNCG